MNLPGGILSALGQTSDFVRNYGKPSSVLSSPCGFNGGIQSQQIGLLGNVLDDFRGAAIFLLSADSSPTDSLIP